MRLLENVTYGFRTQTRRKRNRSLEPNHFKDLRRLSLDTVVLRETQPTLGWQDNSVGEGPVVQA